MKLKFILAGIAVLFLVVIAICNAAPGDVRKTVTTDGNGNILNNPLTLSNQVSMIPAATAVNQLVRYQELTNGLASVSNSVPSGVAFTASNNNFKGYNTFSNTLFLASQITVTNNQPIMSLISTNANQASGGGSLARMEFYTPAFVNGTIIGSSGSTNANIVGSLPGDSIFRFESGRRAVFGNGGGKVATWDFTPGTPTFTFINTLVTTSNDVTVVGNITSTGNTSNIGNAYTSGTITAGGAITSSGSTLLTQAAADLRYRPSGAWYMYIGAVSGGNGLQEGRDTLAGSGVGNAAGIVQAMGVGGSSTLFQLPDFLAGHSVILRLNFVTRESETNQASATVICKLATTWMTNMNTFIEGVPGAGDGSQGGVVGSVTVTVTNTVRQYMATVTNAVPANAIAPSCQFFRAGASDTFTTNAYFWRGSWEMLP